MGLFDFANPGAALWFALALPIIALFILKVRLRRQPVTTLLFWNAVFDEKRSRAWWHRLRHYLSLLLQLALLILLVLALTDPLWSWQREQQRKIVMIVDNSASMATNEGGSTRLEQARIAGHRFIQSLRPGDTMSLLTAGGNPHVECGFTDHIKSLDAALKSVEQVDATQNLTKSVQLAKQLLNEQDSRQSVIYVLTDGCDPEIETLRNDSTLNVYGFGTARENVAITQFKVRRHLNDATSYQVMLTLRNFSSAPNSFKVSLRLNDQLMDVIPVKLDAEATRSLFFEQSSGAGGELVARIAFDDDASQSDGLETDNQAQLFLPPVRKVPVTLISNKNLFLEKALQSLEFVELQHIDTLPPNDELEKRANDNIMIIHEAEGTEAAPLQLDRIPSGKVIVINPRSSNDLWDIGDAIEQPLVTKVQSDSLLVQHVRLENVLFPGAHKLTLKHSAAELINAVGGEPLMGDILHPDGRCVVITTSLNQGDLPLRIAFPILMKNTLEQLSEQDRGLPITVAAGSIAQIRFGSSLKEPVTKPVLLSPSNARLPLATQHETWQVGPLLKCGFWKVVDEVQPVGERHQRTAEVAQDRLLMKIGCNMMNDNESDLRVKTELASPPTGRLAFWGGKSIWMYLTILGVMGLSVEWWLYQRRVVA